MSLVTSKSLMGSGMPQGCLIQRSLRFRSSASAYLSRTFGTPTAATTWTLSCWVKRGALGTAQSIMDANTSGIYFDSGDHICLKNNGANTATSTAVYRDPSAWYHILVKSNGTQSEVYINNSSSTVAYWLGTLSNFNTAIAHNFGRSTDATRYSDCYYAEVNFIDGQALTPSSFGQTDAITGVWTPKKYTGTYGTNGFYLNFSDNTSATTLAYDKSGNSNNWTPNNISTTAGATYDSMTDVPTLTSATAANYAVLNPLFTNTGAINAFYYGNLELLSPSAANSFAPSTISVSSGKFYFEVTAGTIGAGGMTVGIWQNPILNGTSFSSQTNYRYYSIDGKIYNSAGGTVQTYSTYTSNDIIGVALDLDNGKVYYSKNGTWQGSSNPATQTNPAVTGLTGEWVFGLNVGTTSGNYAFANFGQQPFSYTPPTGFKALNTFNLPDPTIKKPNQYMDVVTWSGDNASNRTITGAVSFAVDLAWGKSRTSANDNILWNSVSGGFNRLSSNSTGAENGTSYSTYGIVKAGTNSGDIDIVDGSDATYNMNSSPNTYVSWLWKKGATPGFDIVTYTGTGSGRTVNHSLGVAPKMMIIKNRSTTANWPVWHTSYGGSSNTDFQYLNTTDQKGFATANNWNGTAPTSTVFSVGDTVGVNGNGNAMVAYLFAEIAGFSKFGSYTGNGSADGPFVYCGFRPKYVLWKNTSTGGDGWYTYDSVRQTYNAMTTYLSPTFSVAEGTNGGAMDILSNGFKVRNTGTDMNTNGNTYIFAAFAENPFKYSNAR